MDHSISPTPYADVNLVLDHFRSQLETLLQRDLFGIYLVGSLALGDFKPRSSDIDLIVVTTTAIVPDRFAALKHMHEQFAASDSDWAKKIEAIYVPDSTFRHGAESGLDCPQIEKGASLALAPLEEDWLFHSLTMRDHSAIVTGVDPRPLINTIKVSELQTAASKIVDGWTKQAADDPTWLPWLRKRSAQMFVVQTLCRLLYTVATESVASKPFAAEWVQKCYREPWATFIVQSLGKLGQPGRITQSEEDKTLAFLDFTREQIQGSAA